MDWGPVKKEFQAVNTTRTLALAALTALSLGVGTAMAQNNGGGHALSQYQGTAPQPTTVYRDNSQVQSGSSDMATTRSMTAPATVDQGYNIGDVGG